MFSEMTAKSGDKILSKNGVTFASQFDPRIEATRWVDKLSADRDCNLVCLGAGSGYHLLELVKRIPARQILVIEKYEEVVTWVRDQFDDLRDVSFVSGTALHALLASPEVAEWVTEVFEIVEFRPSVFIDTELYASVRSQLIGRTRETFLEQIRVRPEYNYNEISDRVQADLGGFVSIKSVAGIFDDVRGTVNSSERRIWKILGELIK